MAGLLPGDPSQHGIFEGGPYKYTQDKAEEGGRWYFSRKEIEETSPSKRDGIDLKKEAYLRKSYCTYLQDLGMRLKVPQVTIATAMIFCHRFFLRQSHAKNDRRTIATVCMFLAGKVEETPRPLKDVILVSYEIINKKDPAAVQRIKQKEVYEQQKELILLGERVVLATLGFDFNVHHPYKPLVEAIKKFKVAQNALAQVAWNFVNDGLRTSLCLQFKPHHIAAGAIFLAAKFLKVKLPSDGEKVWWQEFDVTPRQLEEVSNQMLELYEQNRVQASANSEVEGSTGGGANHRAPSKTPTRNEEPGTSNSYSHAGGTTSRPGISKPASSRPMAEQLHADNDGGPPRTTQSRSNDYLSTDMRSSSDHRADGDSNENEHPERGPLPYDTNTGEAHNTSRFRSEVANKEPERNLGRSERIEAGDYKEKHLARNLDQRESMIGQSPQDAIKKIDRDKVKAALEKRRKSRGDVSRKIDLMDEDDLIEKELEEGIELPAESEKNKRERRQNWSKSSNKLEHENPRNAKHPEDTEDGYPKGNKWQSSHESYVENVEEGELSLHDDDAHGFQSPKANNRKRKAGSPIDKLADGKQRNDYAPASHHYNHHDYTEDRTRADRLGYTERDHKRHVPDNHV